jgi:hypothetical protein
LVIAGATVFTVSVVVTTVELVTEAMAGTAQVSVFIEEVPPVTVQLSCTDPVNPPAGRIVSKSVTDSPADAIDTLLVAAERSKFDDADA